MYKASIELAKINKTLKLKFGMIIQSENDQKQPFTRVVNKFNYYGNDYIRINPRPFVTIDISANSDKGDGWSSNQSVNLNKQTLFVFIKNFGKLLTQYKEIKDLYYYENGILKLNNEEAKRIMLDIVSSNKHIRIQPCVVPCDDSEEKFYEGCVLCINTYDNYTYITYSEMEYLYYELIHIDMTKLSLDLLKIAEMYKNSESEEMKSNVPPVSEVHEEEKSSATYAKITEPNTIPEI